MVFCFHDENSFAVIAGPPFKFTEKRNIESVMPDRYTSCIVPFTLPRKVPTEYGRLTTILADRPKKLNVWYKLKTGTLSFPVASVMGRVGSKTTLPDLNEYVRRTAFVWIGVMT
jgi:hypothetical protein